MRSSVSNSNTSNVRLSLKKRRWSNLKSWFSSSLGSIVLHAAIIILLFTLIRSKENAGLLSGERHTEEVGIVFSTSESISTEAETDQLNRNEKVESASSEITSSSEPLAPPLQTVVDQLLPTNEIGLSSRTNASASSSSPSNIHNNSANAGASSGGQTVGFGDVKGSGKKFLYILDRSDSMSWKGGAPMRRAVNDAIASINSLDPKQGANKFQLLVFNHDLEVFQNASGLIDVTLANKNEATRFLRSLVATGGTNPEDAIAKGIKMRPDVVFFLTDADEELSAQALAQIKSYRVQYKVKQICVVEFGKGSEPKKKTFRQLAGENNGVYVFKDIESF